VVRVCWTTICSSGPDGKPRRSGVALLREVNGIGLDWSRTSKPPELELYKTRNTIRKERFNPSLTFVFPWSKLVYRQFAQFLRFLSRSRRNRR